MPNLIETIDRRNKEREFFSDIFAEAGFTHVAMNEIKNRYWNSYSAPPWFAVTTEQGFFEIGWRKHVIHIEWDDVKLPSDHFADQDVTQTGESIHAWNHEKAVEYLTRIRENSVRIHPDSLNWSRSEGEIKLVRDDLKNLLSSMSSDYIVAEFDRLKKDSDY